MNDPIDERTDADRRPALEDLAEALARRLGSETPSLDDRRERAVALLEDIGVGRLVDALTVAERIIRTGEQFHSVERFFVDGSREQRYIAQLTRS